MGISDAERGDEEDPIRILSRDMFCGLALSSVNELFKSYLTIKGI